MDYAKKLKIVLIVFFFFFFTLYLLNSNFLSEIIWKNPYLFGDYKIILSWLECNYLGFDVYKIDSIKNCPNYYRVLLYGHIWLSVPFNSFLKIFYLNYLPYLTIALFLLSTVIIINPKSFMEYLLLSLCIFNPSTFLALERLGFDLFVFLFTIFVCFNRIYILNWLIIFFLTFVKIYPAFLGVNIFLENIKRGFKKNLIIILSITFVSFIYLYFNFDKYKLSLFDSGIDAGEAGYHYLFSIKALPKILKYVFNLNYIFLLIIFYFSFIFIVYKFYKKIDENFFQITKNTFSTNGKLFILSGYISLICFITYSNYVYREIFIILMLPYIIDLYRKNITGLAKFLIIIILIRYFFLLPYGFFNIHDGITYVDGLRSFSNIFLSIITIKGFFDFVLMALLCSFLFLNTKSIINNINNR
tara:strand:+ start:536 stop:1780 length:1245 start_codon:yes stop_codon:yes gene_type:complete